MEEDRADITADQGEKKRRCCEQSFLASVVGLEKAETRQAGPLRRAIGFVVLVGVHLHLLIWSALAAVFVPRYRRITGFQARYFADVMRREWAAIWSAPTRNP